MISNSATNTYGLLFSGGLDSAVVAGRLLKQGVDVQPIYIRCGLFWEDAEFAAAQRYWQRVAGPGRRSLQVLEQPVYDICAGHWSLTGNKPPGQFSHDSEVFLPGRNLLLAIKAALWCQANQIQHLAIGTLASSPFADAQPDFFAALQSLLKQSGAADVQLSQPLVQADKSWVMREGLGFPLELTFSCLAPVGEDHCGECNKCAERQLAFAQADRTETTIYASPPANCPKPSNV